MNILTYCERIANGHDYDNIIQDMYWRDEFDAEFLFDFTLNCAIEENVLLTGVEEFDYETYFRDMWNNTEKGLS